MKQFKIIESADLSTVNVDDTGIITANFAMPITIDVGSSISLDKFTAKIRNDSTVINIPEQVIGVQFDSSLPFINFTIEGGIAPGHLTNIISDELNYRINAVEDATPETNGSQIGLQMYWNLNPAKLSAIGYATINNLNIESTLVEENMDIQTDGLYTFTGSLLTGNFTLNTPLVLLRGGGFQITFDITPQVFEGDYTWSAGLHGANGYGDFVIAQEPNTNKMYVSSTIGPGCFIEIDHEIFYGDDVANTINVAINQVNGYYNVRFREGEIGEYYPRGEILTNIPWNPSQYTGGNPVMVTPISMTFQVLGYKPNGQPYAEATDNPAFGNVVQTTDGGTTNDDASRTVTLDFSLAGYIQTVYGLPAFITCLPINSAASVYNTTTALDTSVFRGNPDIAIEFLDLALESYASGLGSTNNQPTNGVRQPGARCNVLAYFTPLESTVNKSFYSYAQSSYQFLSLANKTAVTFTSLSFRIFSPSTGQPLLADEISFNFLVKGPNE